MAEIVTSKGEVILVDDSDHEFASAITWSVHRGYVRADFVVKGERIRLRLHRYLLGLPPEDTREVDHINGNPLDNRRSNLRVCTRAENSRNRRIGRNNTSGYKGVHFRRQRNKWKAAIKINNKERCLGLFATPEMAHEFYCLAADLLHGEFANHG